MTSTIRYSRPAVLLIAMLIGFAATAARPRIPKNLSRRDAPETLGKPRIPVILAEFSDVTFSVENPAEYFREHMSGKYFSEYEATGSVSEWFDSNSGGRFSPVFEIIGPVKLSKSAAYYGKNTADGADSHAVEMVVEACELAAGLTDFSRFDNDSDGMVDFIYIYHAGKGESTNGKASTLWPASGSLIDQAQWVQGNGTICDRYAFSNEWLKNTPDGIGLFLYQFLNYLGLPVVGELTPGTFSATPGPWDIMDTGYLNDGSRTPPNLSAIERITLGWLEPIRLTEPTECELGDLSETNLAYMIPAGQNPNEYFLLEYRSLSGWDSALPNHGLLIWHIDFDADLWESGAVNDTGDHDRIMLIKPNNIEVVTTEDPDYATQISGWCFPGTDSVDLFTDTTEPAMRSHAGEAVQFPVTEITEHVKVQTVTFVAGDPELARVPVANVPTDDAIKLNTFIASWNPVEGADGYLLTVYPGFEKKSGTQDCDFGYGTSVTLPYGWSASSAIAYTSPVYCGESAPSLRIKDEGGSLTTGWFDAEITDLSFWFRGIKAEASSLAISGKDSSNRWHLIDEISLRSEEGETVVYDAERLPSDIHQIRWKFHRFTGSMALDDIHIVYGEKAIPVYGYANLSVGNFTDYLVDGLPETEDYFRYTVRAIHGDHISIESAPVAVVLGRADVPEVSDGTTPWSLDGHTLRSDIPVTLYTPSGVTVGHGTEIVISVNGIYIVDGGTKKSVLLVK